MPTACNVRHARGRGVVGITNGFGAAPSPSRSATGARRQPGRLHEHGGGRRDRDHRGHRPARPSGGYFEFFSLEDANDTLSNVALSLFLAATITTGLGVLASGCSRPVAPSVRSPTHRKPPRRSPAGASRPGSPDRGSRPRRARQLIQRHGGALQQRVERDARFASDVAHELRSPLMTLSASVEVMEARRDEMPERAQAALDLLVSDVARFRGLVEDLLEISRFDAGAIRLHLEDLRVSQFVRNAVAVSSAPYLEVTISDREPNGDHQRRPPPAGQGRRQPDRQHAGLRRR